MNKKGITLVEVMISVALVAMVVSIIVIAVAQSVAGSRRLDMIYTSSNLAKKHMDDLKAMNFRDLHDRAPETDVRIDLYGEPDANGDYLRSTEVDENWDSNPYLVKVKVTVDKYVSGELSGHPVIMETLFADVE